LYPNCTTIASLVADNGPSFQDIKVFDHSIAPANSPEGLDRVTWAGYCGSGCLFNVEDDPTEHHNLAGEQQFASKLAELQSELKSLNSNVFQPGRGKPSLSACNKAIDIGGFYGPFVDVDDWYTPVPTPGITQRMKDAALRDLLKVTDSAPIENVVKAVADKISPFIARKAGEKLDVCFHKATEEATEIVV